MRRANGTGTITKLSGNRRRPFIARFCIGRNDQGIRQYVTVGYFATKKEASVALSRFAFNPDPMSVSSLTFAEIFELIKPDLYSGKAANTVIAYEHGFKLCASLHNKPVRDLKVLNYQLCLDGSSPGKSTKLQMRKVMLRVCDYAVQNDIISRNYAKFTVVHGTVGDKKPIYSNDEIALLFEDDSQASRELLMLIYSGLRIGEFCNLCKSNINLETRTMVCGSKTKAGINRIVPIHSKVYPFWKECYDNASDYLFITVKGNVATESVFYKRFKALHKRLGIPFRSPHVARHTCASLMARDGVNPVYIKEILGHSSYSFTVDRYTHADRETLVNEIDKVN